VLSNPEIDDSVGFVMAYRGWSIGSIAAVLAFMAGCASPPQGPKETLQGSLIGATALNLRLPAEARARADFNMKGYTLIGAAIVASAVATMNSQSKELDELVAAYVKAHPQQPTLDAAFNTELRAALQARGLKTHDVLATRGNEEKLPWRYQLGPLGAPGAPVLVVDALNARFLAPSSTDPYVPGASAIVTLIEGEAKTRQTTLLVARPATPGGENPSFVDFAEIRKNMDRTYPVMLASARHLAQTFAKSLFDTAPAPAASAAAK
jgi:hypothetical protein